MKNYPRLVIVIALISTSGCDGVFIKQTVKRTELPTKYETISGQRHAVFKAQVDHYKTPEQKTLESSEQVWSVRGTNGEIILCESPTIESCADALQSGSMSGGDDY